MKEFIGKRGFIEIQPDREKHVELIDPESPLYVNMLEPWNASHYLVPRGPIKLAKFKAEIVEKATQPLPAELCDVRSMPIKRPGMKNLIIPEELGQFSDIIQQVADYQVFLNMLVSRHAYLTVNQGEVQPRTTQRISGVHADGLQVGQTEILAPEQSYSCAFGKLQTLFYPNQPIDFTSIEENKRTYAEHIRRMTDVSQGVPSAENVLHLWDSYTLHESPHNETENPIFRTFFRIEFSDRRFAGADAVTKTLATPNRFLE